MHYFLKEYLTLRLSVIQHLECEILIEFQLILYKNRTMLNGRFDDNCKFLIKIL